MATATTSHARATQRLTRRAISAGSGLAGVDAHTRAGTGRVRPASSAECRRIRRCGLALDGREALELLEHGGDRRIELWILAAVHGSRIERHLGAASRRARQPARVSGSLLQSLSTRKPAQLRLVPRAARLPQRPPGPIVFAGRAGRAARTGTNRPNRIVWQTQTMVR